MSYQDRRNKEFDKIAKKLKLNELSLVLQSIYDKNQSEDITWKQVVLDIQILKTNFNLNN